MKSTIKLSGLIYFLQIIQIPSGCNTELLQINVQNQVNCPASIFISLVGPKWRRTSIYGFLDVGLEATTVEPPIAAPKGSTQKIIWKLLWK